MLCKPRIFKSHLLLKVIVFYVFTVSLLAQDNKPKIEFNPKLIHHCNLNEDDLTIFDNACNNLNNEDTKEYCFKIYNLLVNLSKSYPPKITTETASDNQISDKFKSFHEKLSNWSVDLYNLKEEVKKHTEKYKDKNKPKDFDRSKEAYKNYIRTQNKVLKSLIKEDFNARGFNKKSANKFYLIFKSNKKTADLPQCLTQPVTNQDDESSLEENKTTDTKSSADEDSSKPTLGDQTTTSSSDKISNTDSIDIAGDETGDEGNQAERVVVQNAQYTCSSQNGSGFDFDGDGACSCPPGEEGSDCDPCPNNPSIVNYLDKNFAGNCQTYLDGNIKIGLDSTNSPCPLGFGNFSSVCSGLILNSTANLPLVHSNTPYSTANFQTKDLFSGVNNINFGFGPNWNLEFNHSLSYFKALNSDLPINEEPVLYHGVTYKTLYAEVQNSGEFIPVRTPLTTIDNTTLEPIIADWLASECSRGGSMSYTGNGNASLYGWLVKDHDTNEISCFLVKKVSANQPISWYLSYVIEPVNSKLNLVIFRNYFNDLARPTQVLSETSPGVELQLTYSSSQVSVKSIGSNVSTDQATYRVNFNSSGISSVIDPANATENFSYTSGGNSNYLIDTYNTKTPAGVTTYDSNIDYFNDSVRPARFTANNLRTSIEVNNSPADSTNLFIRSPSGQSILNFYDQTGQPKGFVDYALNSNQTPQPGLVGATNELDNGHHQIPKKVTDTKTGDWAEVTEYADGLAGLYSLPKTVTTRNGTRFSFVYDDNSKIINFTESYLNKSNRYQFAYDNYTGLLTSLIKTPPDGIARNLYSLNIQNNNTRFVINNYLGEQATTVFNNFGLLQSFTAKGSGQSDFKFDNGNRTTTNPNLLTVGAYNYNVGLNNYFQGEPGYFLNQGGSSYMEFRNPSGIPTSSLTNQLNQTWSKTLTPYPGGQYTSQVGLNGNNNLEKLEANSTPFGDLTNAYIKTQGNIIKQNLHGVNTSGSAANQIAPAPSLACESCLNATEEYCAGIGMPTKEEWDTLKNLKIKWTLFREIENSSDFNEVSIPVSKYSSSDPDNEICAPCPEGMHFVHPGYLRLTKDYASPSISEFSYDLYYLFGYAHYYRDNYWWNTYFNSNLVQHIEDRDDGIHLLNLHRAFKHYLTPGSVGANYSYNNYFSYDYLFEEYSNWRKNISSDDTLNASHEYKRRRAKAFHGWDQAFAENNINLGVAPLPFNVMATSPLENPPPEGQVQLEGVKKNKAFTTSHLLSLDYYAYYYHYNGLMNLNADLDIPENAPEFLMQDDQIDKAPFTRLAKFIQMPETPAQCVLVVPWQKFYNPLNRNSHCPHELIPDWQGEKGQADCDLRGDGSVWSEFTCSCVFENGSGDGEVCESESEPICPPYDSSFCKQEANSCSSEDIKNKLIATPPGNLETDACWCFKNNKEYAPPYCEPGFILDPERCECKRQVRGSCNDIDSDGTPDGDDGDDDNDGIPDPQDPDPETPNDNPTNPPLPPCSCADTNNDGEIGDDEDDIACCVDSDQDGLPDSTDGDDDNDGIPDDQDDDDDGDGVADEDEADSDQDGIDDQHDGDDDRTDTDGDGVPDGQDGDDDNDGVPDDRDNDDDGDGIPDDQDGDDDNDGVPDDQDGDDDNDGIPDDQDGDDNGDGVPDDQDSDGDGIPDDQDPDDDGDGISDPQDPDPQTPCASPPEACCPRAINDSDCDGINDPQDPDPNNPDNPSCTGNHCGPKQPTNVDDPIPGGDDPPYTPPNLDNCPTNLSQNDCRNRHRRYINGSCDRSCDTASCSSGGQGSSNWETVVNDHCGCSCRCKDNPCPPGQERDNSENCECKPKCKDGEELDSNGRCVCSNGVTSCNGDARLEDCECVCDKSPSDCGENQKLNEFACACVNCPPGQTGECDGPCPDKKTRSNVDCSCEWNVDISADQKLDPVSCEPVPCEPCEEGESRTRFGGDDLMTCPECTCDTLDSECGEGESFDIEACECAPDDPEDPCESPGTQNRLGGGQASSTPEPCVIGPSQ